MQKLIQASESLTLWGSHIRHQQIKAPKLFIFYLGAMCFNNIHLESAESCNMSLKWAMINYKQEKWELTGLLEIIVSIICLPEILNISFNYASLRTS